LWKTNKENNNLAKSLYIWLYENAE
jgi:hypothetical protein